MNMHTVPILSFLIFWPIVAALLVGLFRTRQRAKMMAMIAAVLELLVALLAVYVFDPHSANFQLVEQYSWVRLLSIQYLLGVDGISILFLPLSALLTLMAILASWNSVQNLKRLHFALLLTLQGVTVGVFCALDMILFFLFWELTIPIIFFLLGFWGIGPQRRGAAMKYSLFMLFGGVPLLFGIIILAINHVIQTGGTIPQDLSFSLPMLLTIAVDDQLQAVVFLLFLLAFAVKAPLVPFHTWLPTVSMEGPTQLTALLLGLKLGVYGIMRFAMTLTPSASVQYSWVLGIFGAVTVIYGAFIALQQSNLRRMLAYASISHVGLVIIGIASLNMQGIQGAIMQLLNFTEVASSLMLIAGFIQHRLGSTDLVHLGGLAQVLPRMTVFYFIFMFASIGVPGGNGFPAELLLVVGALLAHPSLGITALVGAVIGAGYMLSFTRRAFLGPIVHPSIYKLQDLRKRELALLILPALLVLLFGFFPNLVLSTNKATADAWLSRLVNQPLFIEPKK